VDDAHIDPVLRAGAQTGSMYTCVADARRLHWEWTREHGPVGEWDVQLREGLHAARASSEGHGWLTRVEGRLTQGKGVLQRLSEVVWADLPDKASDIRDIWRQVFDLMREVQAGIAVLRSWLSVAANY
jgi:hypothetical protein